MGEAFRKSNAQRKLWDTSAGVDRPEEQAAGINSCCGADHDQRAIADDPEAAVAQHGMRDEAEKPDDRKRRGAAGEEIFPGREASRRNIDRTPRAARDALDWRAIINMKLSDEAPLDATICKTFQANEGPERSAHDINAHIKAASFLLVAGFIGGFLVVHKASAMFHAQSLEPEDAASA